MALEAFRAQYPQYNDLSDQDLADRLYAQSYSDMDRADFDARIGMTATAPYTQPEPTSPPPSAGVGMLNTFSDLPQAAMQGTSPIVRTATGELNYEPIAPAEMIGDQVYFRNPEGTLVAADTSKHVALIDPDTGQRMVYKRDPNMETGLLTRLGHLLGIGFAAPATAPRQVVGAATTAARAPRPTPGDFARAGIDEAISNAPRGVVQESTIGALRRTPLVGTPIVNRAQETVRQGGQSMRNVAGQYGSRSGVADAGNRIQQGLERTGQALPDAPAGLNPVTAPTRATSFRTKQNALYDRAFSLIPDESSGQVSQTRSVLDDLASRFENPELAEAFANSRVGRINQILRNSEDHLSFGDLRNLRTELRNMRSETTGLRDIPTAELDRLYGALTGDMRRIVEEVGGLDAARALSAADRYTAAMSSRVDDALRQYMGTRGQVSAEQAYSRLVSDLSTGGRANIARVRDLRRVLPADDWSELASTTLDQLGRPTSQTAAGAAVDDFNITTFLSNYRKISDEGRDVLFGTPRMKASRAELDNLVKVLDEVQQSQAILPPSGAAIMQGALGGGILYDPLTTIGLAGGGRGLSQLLASPRALASIRSAVNAVRPANAGQRLRRLGPALARVNAVIRAEPELAAQLEPIATTLQRLRAEQGQGGGQSGLPQ